MYWIFDKLHGNSVYALGIYITHIAFGIANYFYTPQHPACSVTNLWMTEQFSYFVQCVYTTCTDDDILANQCAVLICNFQCQFRVGALLTLT